MAALPDLSMSHKFREAARLRCTRCGELVWTRVAGPPPFPLCTDRPLRKPTAFAKGVVGPGGTLLSRLDCARN
eukprot:2345696-Alexandrium_andersonii.AAC.1